jgi:phage gp29-like protein
MATNILTRFINAFNPASYNINPLEAQKQFTKNLSGYIAPVQLQRLRHDIQMWREAVTEAENAWYPQRVRMQRMYIDTILSGHTLACFQKRKDLTLMRDWTFKDATGAENEQLKKLLNQPWFANFIEYALEARFFGYSLISLGDLVNDQFPQLRSIRRWNISPDRLNVTQFVYSLSGAQFMEEPFCDWHVWVPTNSDTGASDCGYGLLYNVAQYEILGRNLLGNNSDAAELYGMPVRVGKTQKTSEAERGELFRALLDMGSSGAILLDAMDDLELLESKGNGQGFKIYADLEHRLESKISKLILGHADALDSTPGKLGATQGEESPAQAALTDKQTADGAFLQDVINGTLIPKLINLGFNISEGQKFTFSNNQELTEKRKKEDANNLQTATLAYTMRQAGLEMDPAYFQQRTGIPTKHSPLPSPEGGN